MKKRYLGLLALATILTSGLAVVNEHGFNKVDAAGEPVTITMTTFTATSGALDDVVSFTTAKGEGTSNPQLSSGVIRLYQNSGGTGGGTITLTAKENYTLTSVTIGSSMATKVAYTLDNSTTKSTSSDLAASGKYSVNDINNNSITFYCMGTTSSSRLYVNYLSATYVKTGSEPEEPEFVDGTDEVKNLFNTYNNGGAYIKKTVLNVNKDAVGEVAKYFHASATTRYRKTEYTSESLTMTTSTDGLNYDESEYSKYENAEKDGVKYVKHTGTVGGDYSYYAKETVDDWFVTLSDFKNYNYVSNDWKKDASGVYTYNLTATTATSEHDMTEMAREFVAPMWLAPNENNWNYAKFDKLTVQELSGKLIMKLYTIPTNSGILLANSNLVFSEATISLPKPENFEPVTVTTKIADYATANNWSNGTKYNTVNMDEIVTVKAEHTKLSSGQSYTSSYYTSNPAGWRIYQTDAGKVTVSVAEGYELVSVKITYTVKNTGALTLEGSKVTSGTVVNASGSSIVFNAGNTGTATNGQVGISAIEVTYK